MAAKARAPADEDTQQYSSLISDLQRRFASNSIEEDDVSQISCSSNHCFARTPVQMLGGLVSPYLLKAQARTACHILL